MMTDEEHERRVAALDRAAATPIPRDLSRRIAAEIETHTMNAGIDHGEVMIAVQVAYPLIVEYLAEASSSDSPTGS